MHYQSQRNKSFLYDVVNVRGDLVKVKFKKNNKFFIYYIYNNK